MNRTKFRILITSLIILCSTFLIIFFFETRNDNKELKIKRTNIEENINNLSIKSNIVIEFNKTPKEPLFVNIFPNHELAKRIEGNKLTIAPEYLLPNTEYIINIYTSNSSIDNISFKTKLFKDLSDDEISFLSIKALLEDVNSIEDYKNENTWTNSFPIVEEEFIIFFDYSREKIIANISEKEISEEEVRKEILDRLENLNIPEDIELEVIYY